MSFESPCHPIPIVYKLRCLNSPYEVAKLKGSWLNLCIVSSRCLKLRSFFSDPNHFLDFVCHVEFYPHVFFILLLLEKQSPCWWFLDSNRNHGVCAIYELVRGLIGHCLGWTFPYMVTMVYRRPYLHIRCFQVNFSTSLVVISRNGLASIHLVK